MDAVNIRFSAETNAAQAAIDSFTRHAESRLHEFAGALIAAFSAERIIESLIRVGEKLVDIGDKAIETADDFNKLSQRVGVSTEKLSAWAYAASLANVSQEDFNIGLRTFSRVLADLERSSPQARALFTQIGLSAGPFANMEEGLGAVADRFEQLKDGALKTDAAIAFFGRAGDRMIPMLNEGSDGLAKFEEKARATGNILSGDAAKAAEKFNDNLSEIKKAVAGLALQVVLELLPSLTKLTERLVDITTHLAGNKEGVTALANFFRGLAIAVAATVSALSALGQVNLYFYGTQAQLMGKAINTLVQFFGVFADAIKQTIGIQKEFISKLADVASVSLKFSTGDLWGAWKEGKQLIGETAAATERYADAIAGDVVKAGKLVFGFFTESKDRVVKNGESLLDSLVRDWTRLLSFSKLFAFSASGSPGSSSAAGTSDNSKKGGEDYHVLSSDTEKMLNELSEAYRKAFTERSEQINVESKRQLAEIASRILTEKHLRLEDLANDADYQRAKTAIEALAAKERSDLARANAEELRKIQVASLNNAITAVQGNALLTNAQKRAQIVPNIGKQLNINFDAQQSAEDDLMFGNQTERIAAEQQLNTLTAERIALVQQLQQLDSGATDALVKGVVALRNETDSLAGAVQLAFSAMDRSASAFGQSVAGLIDGTTKWGQSFGQVAKSIIADFATLVAKTIAGKLAIMAVDAVTSAASLANSKKEAVVGAVAGLGKASEQGGWVGALIYLGVYAASLAAIMGIVAGATGGFAEGGVVEGAGTGTSDSILSRLSNGEFVVNAAAVKGFRPLLEGINAGRFQNLNALQANLASARGFGVTAPVTSSARSVDANAPGLAGSAGAAFGAAPVNVAPTPVNVVVLDSEEKVRQFLESNAAGRIVVKHVRNNKGASGFET